VGEISSRPISSGGKTFTQIGMLDGNKPWTFEFTIKPAELIPDNMANEDVPDLRGANKTAVPGANKPYFLSPPPPASPVFADSNIEKEKWDVTRTVSISVLNNSLLSQEDLGGGPMWQGQPAGRNETTFVLDFPEDPVEGNDDPLLFDEASNPYVDFAIPNFPDLDHPLRGMTSRDKVKWVVPNGVGIEGDKIQIDFSFREFCRLEINKIWYRTSDYIKWDVCIDFVRENETWTDDGSETRKR